MSKIKFLMYLAHLSIFLTLISCQKEEDLAEWPPTINDFQNFKVTQSLNGMTDVDFYPTIKFSTTPTKRLIDNNVEYNAYILLFDALGNPYRTTTSYKKLGENMWEVTLGPLPANRIFYYEFRLILQYPVIPNASFLCCSAVELVTSNNYSFKTQKDNNRGLVEDMHRNQYETLKIGTQEWFLQNLRTEFYSNGDRLDTYPVMSNLVYPTYYQTNYPYFQFDYGYPYHIAANRVKNICPDGWRTPTPDDFQTLISFLENKYGSNFTDHINIESSNSEFLSFLFHDWQRIDFWTREEADEAFGYALSIYADSTLSTGFFFNVSEVQKTEFSCIRCMRDIK